ncbi:RNA polymerase sigma factor [Amycolatopsis sp. H6(2020)]|nr:RNA polymerase sigma factor [Amycolatopsis sp. H6(2020)]
MVDQDDDQGSRPVTDPADSTTAEPTAVREGSALERVLACDRLQDKLHWFIRRRIPGDQPDAESVYWATIEAFGAYADRKEFPPADDPKVLFGIANNKITDYWRVEGRKRHSVLVEPSDLHHLTRDWPNPYESVEQRVDLARALAEAPLDDTMRQALVLVVVDQLSQDEAAAVMDVDRSSLRRLLKKAFKLIRSSGRLDAYAHHFATTMAQRTAEPEPRRLGHDQ